MTQLGVKPAQVPLGRTALDVGQALGIGVAGLLLAIGWPFLLSFFVDLNAIPPLTAGRLRASITVQTFLVQGLIGSLLEVLLMVVVLYGLGFLHLANRVRIAVFVALCFAFGFIGYGASIGAVGRALVYSLLGWQCARYAVVGRWRAAYWLTLIAHLTFSLLLIALAASRG